MKSHTSLCSAVTGAVLFFGSTALAASIDPIIMNGKHFFYSGNQTEFFFRGVAYQQDYNAQTASFNGNSYTDPLADGKSCKRDIPYLKQLRTNVIRTYAINPKFDHSECMNALAAAGIYVISDLSAPEESITSNEPEWTTDLFNRYAAVVDALSGYDNTIGFFAGNEVVNTPNQSPAAAFVKAAVRDMKAYIKHTAKRPLYVGYATSDVPIRDQLTSYFACGDDSDSVDFWGYNVYSWCGPDATYQSSNYAERTNYFRSYPKPAFFAEYGCIIPPPRTFDDTPVLYGPKMAPVWSGGIVYEYFQTANKYGLVTVNGDKVTPLPDFNTLKQKIANVNPSLESYNSVDMGSPVSCPATSSQWKAKSSPLPPAANPQVCDCLTESLECVVKDSVPLKQYAKQFKYICGQSPSACDGISADASTGSYGSFSPCDAKTKLSYVMNKYYQMHGRSSDACSFGGAATTKGSSSPGSCKSLLSAAGTNGQGNVPEPTHAASTGDGDGSGSPSGGNAASGLTIPKLGVYTAIAALTLAGMLIF